MSVDNPSIIDIGTLIVIAFVGAVAAVIAFLTYLQGKYREKNDFLINIIRILDDNANRNARRRWFNTYGLKNDTAKEVCLDHMNALTEARSKGYSEEDITIYAKSNILESQYKTLSNFDLASLFINRYTLNKLIFWSNSKSKLDKDVLLQMYILDFLSIRKIRESDQDLKEDMKKRFINLEKFFDENTEYLNDKENQYPSITLPIKDIDECKEQSPN